MSESYEVLKKQYDDLKNKKLFGSDIYQAAANHYEPIIAELVQALKFAREKLEIECGGVREYKGGMQTQELFPMIDALIAKHTVK